MIDRRPLESFPGYLAGADGRIYSTKGGQPRALRPRRHHRTGHERVRLYGKAAEARVVKDHRTGGAVRSRFVDAYVHVLVCLAWHGVAPFDGALVLHADDDPANNAPGNLRWGSHVDNAADRRANADEAAHEASHREGKRLGDGPGAALDERWGF